MSFPIQSTSIGTASTKRIERVLQRSKIGSGKTRIVKFASRFVCKKIVGSSSWSQHSWGNADDLFPTDGNTQEKLRHIADAVVYQAKHRTVANRGRKLDVAEVIDHDARRIWTPAGGWGPYGGTLGAHIHVTGAPKRTGTPACA
jgi:hypothetical protein